MKGKRNLWLLLSALCLLILALLLDGPLTRAGYAPVGIGLYVAAYLLSGAGVLKKAGRNILHGQIFDENFLMSVASLGALIIGEYPEAAAVMIFYKIGETFEQYAVNRSRRSIQSLMAIRPDTAHRLLEDGGEETVDAFLLQPGDTFLVRPGERVPLDGVVLTGESRLDTSALTGESVPRRAAPGDTVLSGCVNESAALTLRATCSFGESTASRIIDMVENAAARKSRQEAFITRFAAVYTPVVVLAAVLLAILPPLLVPGQAWSVWVYRALTFLVVSCPCALVISVPLSFFGGIGGASRLGVLVKGGQDLEALSRVETAAFDKTGTLTAGVFDVQTLSPAPGVPAEALLQKAAAAESLSTHPIARSLHKAATEKGLLLPNPQDMHEVPGRGVCAQVDGRLIRVGNRAFLQEASIPLPEIIENEQGGALLFVAEDTTFLGTIVISDAVRPNAAKALTELRQLGVKKIVMLSGDTENACRWVSSQLSPDEVHAGLLPGDKVHQVEALLTEKNRRGTVLFLGDGINDAPVLARADVGVAMGGLGSDAAMEAADVVLMHDNLLRLSQAIRLARRTMRIVKENIVFALLVKIGVLILSAFGFANMWAAVFADVGVAVLAILNALRALSVPRQ